MKKLLLHFFALTMLCSAAPRVAIAQPAMKQPNVIFVLTDDTGYGDLSAHGHPLLKTPQLDRMHSQSVRFTDFHVSPTCSPTRSALLTGRHEFKNGITHTILERERLTLTATTLPQVLKSAGYTSGIFGKWHLGDEDEYQPNKRGFDEVFIHGGGGIGQTYPGSCGDAPGNKYQDPVILHNGTFEKTQGFCTDVFFAQAMKWIGEKRNNKTPFFCYIPLNAAHQPVSCPPQWKTPYEGKVPDQVATFYGMIANIDFNVGALLDKLDEWGIAENTLVIFMNDNGGSLGTNQFNAGMRGSKGSAWLGGTRAASFWRWKGRFTPREVPELAAHIDFFSTLAELGGAKLDEKARAQNEGRSLVPFLRGEKIAWPARTLVTHLGRWPKGADPQAFKYAHCSVREGQWHLVNTAKEKKWQLFDVKNDSGEQTDIAAAQPDVVARLDAAYDKWWAETVPLMVNENAVFPPVNPFKELYWKQFGGPGPNNVPRGAQVNDRF